MKNKDVVIAFLNGKNAKGSNLRSEGGKLYSYSSLMAKWHGGVIIVYMNIATYSMTSKRHWYYLRTEAPQNKLIKKD